MPLIYKGLWIKWKKTLNKTENIFLIPKKVLSLECGKQTTTLKQKYYEANTRTKKINSGLFTTLLRNEYWIQRSKIIFEKSNSINLWLHNSYSWELITNGRVKPPFKNQTKWKITQKNN